MDAASGALMCLRRGCTLLAWEDRTFADHARMHGQPWRRIVCVAGHSVTLEGPAQVVPQERELDLEDGPIREAGCDWCGATFRCQAQWRANKRRYCSRRCADTAREQGPMTSAKRWLIP